MLTLTPKQLDQQSLVHIDKWVDLGSEEHLYMDNDVALTKKWINMGLKDAETPAFLAVDSSGRIWSAKPNEKGKYYPFHFEYGKKLIGIKNSKVASN